jgi:hypothetical protein
MVQKTKVNIQASVQKALASDRERTSEIKSLGAKFGFTKDAEQFVNSGKTLREFQAHILAKSPGELKVSLGTQSPVVQAAESRKAVATIKERRSARLRMA